MADYSLNISITGTERTTIRREVFQYWLDEKPGSLLERNRYRYSAEILSDKSEIFLERPARLNKGADFVINCTNYLRFKTNHNPKPPKHKDLLSEITAIAKKSQSHKAELLSALEKIWQCKPSATVVQELSILENNLQAERALLLAKWMFIEQDVTYWTESGRYRLFSRIKHEIDKII